eukprot:8346823-Pyramimonas_sp.AAC.1
MVGSLTGEPHNPNPTPMLSEAYAATHVAISWETFCRIFATTQYCDDHLARQIATAPGRFLGGLGLQAAERSART